VVLGFLASLGIALAEPPFPRTREEVIALKEDVWAEAAIRQPGGPSYEFFRDLFPPVKYVNAKFHMYPIELSAPGAKVKARYVSNGSAINPKADQKPMWYDPAHAWEIQVGDDGELFGDDPDRLEGPHYLDGYLPIVQTTYRVGKARAEQEAFACVTEPQAAHGAVIVRLTARGGTVNFAVRVPIGPIAPDEKELANKASLNFEVTGGTGTAKWIDSKSGMVGSLADGQSFDFGVFTKSHVGPQIKVAFDAERKSCIETWKSILARGVNLEVPEPIVQNAWRACVVGNEMIAVGDKMNYSAGNAYDHLYEGECGDATRALMFFGQVADARRFIGPLLDFPRQDTKFHVAGHKLQLLAHYYLVTRDKEYMKEKEAVWNKVIDLIVDNRQPNGLMPPDRYAGDINKPVFSLSSNAACWRGLRDMAVVLHDLGDHEKAMKLEAVAKDYKAAILGAVAKSERHETKPPFIPIPLLADEKPFDPLTATRLGSYYDLMIPYVLGSDIFMGSERESWIIDYLRHHGGLAMGMIRNQSHQGPAANEPANNVLYGLRYMLTILRRDDVGHALAGFYGQLAQAMTRDTFIGGEASRLFEGDSRGRMFYLPPNSAANAMFLETLRYLLIQDWQDENGKPHELRLLHGVPSRWLEAGKLIKFERAPTLFGPVSLRVYSQLSKGVVTVDIESPPRAPEKWVMRLPLPPGWKVTRARIGEQTIKSTASGEVDLTGEVGSFQVRYEVKRD
jgi:hypothetical protein